MQESGIDWSDAEAVASLVQQERQRLLAFVHQRMSAALRQRVDADDIIQEVCLSAVRPAGSQAAVVPQRDPFSWLCHVAEQRIRMLIEELPEEQRQAVRLRYVDGLPTREIAARLGKSDVAVRVMLSRTMQKLQAAFPEAE